MWKDVVPGTVLIYKDKPHVYYYYVQEFEPFHEIEFTQKDEGRVYIYLGHTIDTRKNQQDIEWLRLSFLDDSGKKIAMPEIEDDDEFGVAPFVVQSVPDLR